MSILDKENDNKPLVSVICLCYNHSSSIRETLDGFLKQNTKFKFEVIVHDDASTDDSQTILRDYEVKYPHLFKNIYQSVNQYSKDIGLISDIVYSAVSGKYVAICEGDDYWIDSLKLQKQVDYLEREPNCDLVYTDAIFKYESNGQFVEKKNKQIEGFEELLIHNNIWTLTTCFRASKLKLYCDNFLPKLRHLSFGDYSLWLFILMDGKAKYLKGTSSVYRISSNSASNSKDITGRLKFINDVNFLKRFYIENYPNEISTNTLKQVEGVFALDIFQTCIKYNDYTSFINYEKEIKNVKCVSFLYYIVYIMATINFKIVVNLYNRIKK